MTRTKPFGVISLRRVLLGAAGLAGAALTLWLAVGAAVPAPDGRWSDIAALTRVFTGGTGVAGEHGASAVQSFGLITVIVAPRESGLTATLFRDGLAAGRFAGGPLTIAVRSGDVLRVAPGSGGLIAQVRVLAVSPNVALPVPQTLSVRPGETVSLGAVRLRGTSGPA